MEPDSDLDKHGLREVERQLTAELDKARWNLQLAATDAERQGASVAFDRAMQRFRDFAAYHKVPKEFLPREG